MFEKTAEFYDLIYTWKDYEKESADLHELIQVYCQSDGKSLLDVACGTGKHLEYLQKWYQVEGLDLDKGLLKIAELRLPGTAFYHQDMIDFELGQQYDIVTCLFSAIAYTRSIDKLEQAVSAIRQHTRPGGIAIIEAWIYPDDFQEGYLSATYVDEPGIKVSRMSISRREGDISIFDFHYLIGTPDDIVHQVEHHELGLFTHQDYVNAIKKAGLEIVHHDPVGISGRGLYIGQQPA